LTLTQQVEQLYAAYPKKIAPRTAKAAIKRSLQRNKDKPFVQILINVKLHAANFVRVKGTSDWQYVPHPTTYFNGDSWAGEVREFKIPESFCKVSYTPGVDLEWSWRTYLPRWRKCGCDVCSRMIERWEGYDPYAS